MTKVCTKCKEEKPLEGFPIAHGRKRKDGTRCSRVHSQCAECRRALHEDWKRRFPDKAKAATSRWKANNSERLKQTVTRYKAVNADRVKAWKKAWDERNKVHVYLYNKALRANPDYKALAVKWQKMCSKKMREKLMPCYVKKLLRKQGLDSEAIEANPILIELKRLEIKTKRALKSLTP